MKKLAPDVISEENRLEQPLLADDRAKDEYSPPRDVSRKWPFWLVVLFIILGATKGFIMVRTRWIATTISSSSILGSPSHPPKTVLSVVDATSGEYISVFDQHAKYDNWNRQFDRRRSEHIMLSLDKTRVTRLYDSITLSWKQVSDDVSDDDVVVLWCEPFEFVVDAATIAQARATSRKHIWPHYKEKHEDHSWYIPKFPITRQVSCHFTLYKSTDGTPLASTADLELLPLATMPMNIHIALAQDPSQMVLQFATGTSGKPVASYGKKEPSNRVEGHSVTYKATDMCGAPANDTNSGKFVPPGYLHTVVLSNLEPNTTYHYKVGLTFGQGVVWSDIFEFISAPEIGSYPYSYIVYGDQGCPTSTGLGGAWTTALVAEERNARAVHHFGDLSYARGAAHVWDEWMSMVQLFATRLPLMVGVGNHEYDHQSGGENGKDPSGVNASHGFMPQWGNMGDDSGGECGVPTSKRFTMPHSEGSNGVFWYSYDSASVHTVMLSSEHDLRAGSRQYKWFESDLKALNRTLTPWLVVELHRPLYMNEAYWAQNTVGLGLRQSFEAILKEYNVDLVLSGHYHSYFRSCHGLYRSKCDNGGPTHVTIGTAGYEPDQVDLYDSQWAARNIQGKYGYGRITIPNSTALLLEFVQVADKNNSAAGKVLDSVWFTKK